MPLIEYVGEKPMRDGHPYTKDIVWDGKGDRKMVPDAVWSHMRKHRDVWREVSGALEGGPAPAQVQRTTLRPPNPAAGQDGGGADGVSKDTVRLDAETLNAMERNDLYALAVRHDLKPHSQLGKPRLVELLLGRVSEQPPAE